jgi:pimeloyl-ACP methyl ester carboxylesterase
MVDIDIAIKSLDRHIEKIEAVLAFKIKSYNDSLRRERREGGVRRGEGELPYDLKREIAAHEEELSYAMRLRRNLISMKQNGMVTYSTPERHTNIGNNIIRYLVYGPTRTTTTSSNNNNNNNNNNIKTVVPLHGIGPSAERWSRVIPGLLKKQKNLRVIIPDIIGFGYSDKPRDVDYTVEFFVQSFLKPFLDNFGISNATIIGSSFGGQIAAEFAIEHPDLVEELVLVSPAGMMRQSNQTLDRYIATALNPDPKFEQVYEAFTEMVYDPSVVDEESVIDFMNRMRLPNAKYALTSTLVNMMDAGRRLEVSGRLAAITAPTLIIWGENDRVIPIQYSHGFRVAIPNNKFVVIPMCGHTPHYETPDIFNLEILAWANWRRRRRRGR